ncbi:MAG: hypothetical protein VYA08_12145, partial [Pseudomonadota bacterium]|nr:hypothetical protein [Pseudomonadota bacterium]
NNTGSVKLNRKQPCPWPCRQRTVCLHARSGISAYNPPAGQQHANTITISRDYCAMLRAVCKERYDDKKDFSSCPLNLTYW